MTKKASSSFKEKLFKKRLGFIGIFVSIVVSLLVGGGSVYYFMNKQVKELETANQSLGKISSIYSTLYYNYYKQISQKKLTDGAINGMISALGDPFSEYMSETESSNLNDTMSGSFGGIGTQVEKSSNAIKVIAPIAGTPASKAGIKANDLIVKINGRQTSDMTLNKAVQIMRGKVGTKVTITIKRNGQTFDKILVRAKIPVKTVTETLDSKNKSIGVIAVTTFSQNTAKEMKQAIVSLRKQGAKSFVIDMRNNPGGLMDQALKMSSMFVKDGKVILQVASRSGKPTIYRAGKQFDNGFKVHDTLPFKDKTELKLTIAKWLTPNGTWIHHKGLQPDIKADYPSIAYVLAPNVNKELKLDDSGSSVESLQKMLNFLGYDAGKENGYFSEKTQKAVEAYQKENKLTVNGKADTKTLTTLETQISQKINQNDPVLEKAEEELR